ncbi:hypothetical protein F511_11935 [Dorcoceras hygrometricum]|uniref:Uncharacterized protein n=1 Tax=Dorcoceras hygrometricum TaxID=472368 RepID=A0A2Z7CKX1_9LAMI|nr:hypothetical protein F511_11935 [Dorcoceras hygrometricum]
MTFRVVSTNQYNQYLGLIHSTNGNHLESPNDGSSIDHQETDLEEEEKEKVEEETEKDKVESVEIETAEKYVEEETAKVEEENKDEETEKEATNKGKRDVEAIDSENTEPLSKQIPEDMMLPSVTAEKPSKIEFGHGIEIKEVDWHKATLPTIDPMDKGKAPLGQCRRTQEALSQKITLDMGFAQSISHQEMVFRAEINNVHKEVQIQKAALTQELTAFHLETQEGLNTLHDELSEIIAYLNRGRDDKKGEESSRGPQPEDQSRPSGGGGSSSEPSRKRGGSYRGRGSRISEFSRWFS